MPVISLMTDFGLKDGNVGVMKGVIWGICPSAQISDLSHLIQAQNIREPALILARSVLYFPAGSIHVVVVDPGVGTNRRPMAARIGSQYFVGPDNGIITLWLDYAESEKLDCQFVHLDRPEFWRPDISHVFHGRDIFSPVAGHLAAGVPIEKLGTPMVDPVRMGFPKPRRTASGWEGEIIHIDHFGNLTSNIRIDDLGNALDKKERFIVSLADTEIHGLVNTFGDKEVGDLIALMGSTGNLIISVVNGSAAAKINAKIGDKIDVKLIG